RAGGVSRGARGVQSPAAAGRSRPARPSPGHERRRRCAEARTPIFGARPSYGAFLHRGTPLSDGFCNRSQIPAPVVYHEATTTITPAIVSGAAERTFIKMIAMPVHAAYVQVTATCEPRRCAHFW